MNSRIQILAIVGSVLFLLLVLELVRRRRLAEEYSALWIVAALALLVASVRRDLIDRTATWLGIYYGPAVLLLGLVVVVSAVLLWMSVILSRQQAQIDHLIEEAAILSAELREHRSDTERGRAERSPSWGPPSAALNRAPRSGSPAVLMTTGPRTED
jgi:hypothetical protein